MLRNYFTIALRGLLKNKSFSFVNVAGLSIGLAGVITRNHQLVGFLATARAELF